MWDLSSLKGVHPEFPALEDEFLTPGPPGRSHNEFFLRKKEISDGPPVGTSGEEPACHARDKRCGFDPWVGQIPWRREGQPTPAFLPGESHGLRSLVGYSPWGRKESDTLK